QAGLRLPGAVSQERARLPRHDRCGSGRRRRHGVRTRGGREGGRGRDREAVRALRCAHGCGCRLSELIEKHTPFIPAKAGIQDQKRKSKKKDWTPAFAGVSGFKLWRMHMRYCHDELTLDELLADPVIGAVMRADGVDPDALGSEFARFAEEREEVEV